MNSTAQGTKKTVTVSVTPGTASVKAVLGFTGCSEREANAMLYLLAAALELVANGTGGNWSAPEVNTCESWGGQYGEPRKCRGSVKIETATETIGDVDRAQRAMDQAVEDLKADNFSGIVLS